jgi:hypothetical protein
MRVLSVAQRQFRGLSRRRRRVSKWWRRTAKSDPLRTLWLKRFRFTYSRTLAHVPLRAEIPQVLQRRRLLGRGVEIGVMKGGYSATILREWSGRELISVDPWLEHPENEAQARARLAPYGERSTVWRMTSAEASEQIRDGELDFAYIDALHDYDSVKLDLECWFPKVRPGGILAGHDYPEPGVRSAVDEFARARGLRVHSTGAEPAKRHGRRKNPSWLLEVPR